MRTNRLLVNVPPDAIEQIEQLVHVLDVSGAPPDGESGQMRFLWLIDRSLAQEKAEHVPADVQPAIAKLSKKLGLGEMRTAAQMMINIGPSNQPFMSSGTAMLLQPCDIHFEGVMNLQNHVMQVTATAHERGSGGSDGDLCKLNTIINASPGHPVILGMMTVESKPSIFIIEILKKSDDEAK